MSTHPYAERFPVNRGLPESGRPEDELLDELRQMATEEDAFWETGKCSGTMYCGDHEHYEFMGEAFQLFAHANILQRDMFPSATKLEGEIIAMTMDLMHGEAAEGGDAVGMVTTGGTGSIMHAILAYREQGRNERGIERPNIIKPETAHAAFDKAAHLFDIELRRAPVDPETTKVRPEVVADLIDDSTVAIIGSACNYGYGTVDPIAELGALAQERGIGLHVDGCLGGFILPWGEQLGYPVPPVRLPGAGRDLDLGRHPQVRLRPQGHVGAALPGPGPAEQPVLLPHRLDRWQVLLAGDGGLPVGGPPRRDLGRDAQARPRAGTCATPSRSSRPAPPCRRR